MVEGGRPIEVHFGPKRTVLKEHLRGFMEAHRVIGNKTMSPDAFDTAMRAYLRKHAFAATHGGASSRRWLRSALLRLGEMRAALLDEASDVYVAPVRLAGVLQLGAFARRNLASGHVLAHVSGFARRQLTHVLKLAVTAGSVDRKMGWYGPVEVDLDGSIHFFNRPMPHNHCHAHIKLRKGRYVLVLERPVKKGRHITIAYQ